MNGFTGGALALVPSVSRASDAISKTGLRNVRFTLAVEFISHHNLVSTITINVAVKPGTFFDSVATA
ncbi:hypothetical protein ABE021_06350 [Sporosarcina gallistercoris]|uniref:hypothetical protein n=1 Tax=Sporosarcina gallistercoris TaxID=2762245 RepID=UPI003D272533